MCDGQQQQLKPGTGYMEGLLGTLNDQESSDIGLLLLHHEIPLHSLPDLRSSGTRLERAIRDSLPLC